MPQEIVWKIMFLSAAVIWFLDGSTLSSFHTGVLSLRRSVPKMRRIRAGGIGVVETDAQCQLLNGIDIMKTEWKPEPITFHVVPTYWGILSYIMHKIGPLLEKFFEEACPKIPAKPKQCSPLSTALRFPPSKENIHNMLHLLGTHSSWLYILLK